MDTPLTTARPGARVRKGQYRVAARGALFALVVASGVAGLIREMTVQTGDSLPAAVAIRPRAAAIAAPSVGLETWRSPVADIMRQPAPQDDVEAGAQ